MTGNLLNVAQVRTNFRKISTVFACMLHSMFSYFLNNRVYHLSTSSSSSGEQISGHSYPSPSTTCLTIFRVKGLFR